MVQHGKATVHAGIPRCYPGCLRWCPGNCRLRHGYMPVAPRLRPGVTLDKKVVFCLYRIIVIYYIQSNEIQENID